MSNESLKSAILAKCGEQWVESMKPMAEFPAQINGIHFRLNQLNVWRVWNESGTIDYTFAHDTPADDPVWLLAAKILEIQEPPFPRYDRDFEQSIFDWADKNDDLGWATDGRHTFKSVSNNGLIRGAIYMYDRLKRVFPASIPSEDILWEAFQKGAYWNSFSSPSTSMKEKFDEFLKEFSADPLQAKDYRWLISGLEEIVGDYSTDTRSSLRSILDEWKEGMPADTIGADRALVMGEFTDGELERDVLNSGYSYKMVNAIKRLCGLEVGND